MALIDALPLPVTLPCFLQALQRPLTVEASTEIFSAQPAQGQRSPRIFVHDGQLALSVVPVGEARDLLELGEHYDERTTIKAELQFPITGDLSADAPFVRARDDAGDGTCAVCHGGEVEVSAGVFASTALRPHPDKVVPISSVAWEARQCDPALEPERCGILDGIFGHGDVVHAPFPSHYPTVYDER